MAAAQVHRPLHGAVRCRRTPKHSVPEVYGSKGTASSVPGPQRFRGTDPGAQCSGVPQNSCPFLRAIFLRHVAWVFDQLFLGNYPKGV